VLFDERYDVADIPKPLRESGRHAGDMRTALFIRAKLYQQV
jgi:hypothetical protein